MDTTQIVQLINISEVPENVSESISVWFWVALGEMFFILLLLLLKQKKQKSDFVGVSKSDFKEAGQNADMKNLVNSIAKSQTLYKELSRKCHPDRFVNTPLQVIAEELFQEISLNKRNYKKLIALKEVAIEKLNINF
jgi:hypothetical protein